MIPLIKQLFRPQPRISHEQALRIARTAYQKRGGDGTGGRLRVTQSRHVITVIMNTNSIPYGPRIKINAHTSEVISVIPRPLR